MHGGSGGSAHNGIARALLVNETLWRLWVRLCVDEVPDPPLELYAVRKRDWVLFVKPVRRKRHPVLALHLAVRAT